MVTQTVNPERVGQSAWHLSPYIMMRLAGKPYEELESLKFSRTVKLIDRILDIETYLDTTAEQLCDALHEHIGLINIEGEAGSDLKVRLVNIKRDIFNRRSLNPEDWQLLKERLPATYTEELKNYYQQDGLYQQFWKEGESTFEKELEEKRALLKRSFKDVNFQNSLQLTSQSLWQQLSAYLKSNKNGKKERRTEMSCFRYLTRMIAKTSPFARFGTVALVKLGDEARFPKTEGGHLELKTVSQLNLSIVAHLSQILALHPAIQTGLYPRVNDTAYCEGDEIIFIQRRILSESNMTAGVYRRGVYRPEMSYVIDMLKQHQDGTLNLNGFLMKLAERLPAEQAPQIQHFALRLVQSGLITLEIPVPGRRFDHLSWFYEHLKEEGLKTGIARLRTLEKAFGATEDSAERQKHLEGMLEQLQSMAQMVGYQLSEKITPDSFIMEDARLFDERIQLDEQMLGDSQDAIEAWLNFLYARDQRGYAYYMVHEAFLKLFGEGGTCDNLVKFAYDQQTIISENLTGDPAFTRLNQVMQQNKDYMYALGVLPRPQVTDEEIVHSVADIHHLTERFLEPINLPRSIALNVQVIPPATDGEAYQLVFNHALPGYGHFFSRYCYLFDSLADDIRAQLDMLQDQLPYQPEPVEILTVSNNNAQVHPSFTRREIVIPGEYSDKAPENQISLDELTLRHDPVHDRLQLYDGDDRPIEPLYLGFFHNASIQNVERLLVDLSLTGQHLDDVKPAGHFDNILHARDEHTLNTGDLEYYPRIRIDQLIVQRRTWVYNARTVRRLSAPDSFTTFVQVLKWLKSRNMPRHVFMRSKHDDPFIFRQLFTSHKPLPLDLENYFCVRDLLNMTEQSSLVRLLFEEMLPTPDEQVVRVQDEDGKSYRYISEFQIELNREANQS